jgi:hypothetical protein
MVVTFSKALWFNYIIRLMEVIACFDISSPLTACLLTDRLLSLP